MLEKALRKEFIIQDFLSQESKKSKQFIKEKKIYLNMDRKRTVLTQP
jgi:hypothetical protein